MLKNNIPIEELHLDHNHLDDDCVRALIGALQNNTNLRHLNISHNNITPDCLNWILSVVETLHLDKLTLTCSDDSDSSDTDDSDSNCQYSSDCLVLDPNCSTYDIYDFDSTEFLRSDDSNDDTSATDTVEPNSREDIPQEPLINLDSISKSPQSIIIDIENALKINGK